MSDKTKDFFDKRASCYKNEKRFDESLSNMLEIDLLEKSLGLSVGSRLIELGCGVGRCVLPLLKRGYRVTGVDISRDSLSVLEDNALKRNLAKSLDILESDFNTLIYKEVFDGAFCASTVHLLANTSEGRRRIFSNFVSSVKKGGVVVVAQPNPFNPLYYPFYLFFSAASWAVEKNFLKYSLPALKRLFSEIGLKEIRYEYYGMLPTRWINQFPYIYRINTWLCRLPIVRHFAAFIFMRGVKQDG